MWKPMPFLTCLTGKSIYSRSLLVLALLFCLLCRIANADPVTNVDFVVIAGRHDIDMPHPEPWQSQYNSYPVGRLLFWTVIFDDTQTRGEIYRSESGHVGFIKQIAGGEVFVIANESGGPASWLLDSDTIYGDYYGTAIFGRPPHVWNKPYYDIFATSGTGNRGSLYNASAGVLSSWQMLDSFVGSIAFRYADYSYYGQTLWGVIPVVRHWEPAGNGSWQYRVQKPTHHYSVYATWRASQFDLTLDFFKLMLDTKWWLTGKFAVQSWGITGIGYGAGDQGASGQSASGSAGGSGGGGGGGGITTLPGAIDDPPITPLGLNGRWVYDPETKLWKWIGDIADNASQINPYDNSVMPENQERGLAQESTLRQIKDGVDGLAQESTLQKILISAEEFQKQQRITPEQFQSMLDNGVVALKDGMIEYWEGKNLGAKLDGIDSSVDEAGNRVVSAVGAVKGQVGLVKDSSATTAQKAGQIALALSPFGNVGGTINNINANIVTSGDNIVNAIEGSKVDLPTTEEQDKEDVDISEPDLSLLDNLLTFNFPTVNLPVVTEFEDYEIGVFDWKIPFSYFSQSRNTFFFHAIWATRSILKWLVYLSATLAVLKAMGGGV